MRKSSAWMKQQKNMDEENRKWRVRIWRRRSVLKNKKKSKKKKESGKRD
jgi:hypothetical protein